MAKSPQTKRNYSIAALVIGAFLAGGGLSLLYVYMRPIKIGCFLMMPQMFPS